MCYASEPRDGAGEQHASGGKPGSGLPHGLAGLSPDWGKLPSCFIGKGSSEKRNGNTNFFSCNIPL